MAARTIAPRAPTPLASVGVVIPAKMEPSTARIRHPAGRMSLKTQPEDHAS